MGHQGHDAAITEFLRSIHPTGESGFEGLIVTPLEKTTHQRFRLSASGEQHGQDADSERGGSNYIKVETKLYRGRKSRLRIRELIGEFAQATIHGTCPDLWVLAATFSIKSQQSQELEEFGYRNGVEVLLLDRQSNGFSRLAVLMAAFPSAVSDWAHRHGYVLYPPALEHLAQEEGFAEAKNSLLTRLASSLSGYADARRRVNTRLLNALGSKQSAAAEFKKRLGIRDPLLRKFDRPAIHAEIDAWGQSRGSHAAVLGEEGAGKTWAVMEWGARGIEAARMPICLPFLPAIDLSGVNPNLRLVLPRQLAKWHSR